VPGGLAAVSTTPAMLPPGVPLSPPQPDSCCAPDSCDWRVLKEEVWESGPRPPVSTLLKPSARPADVVLAGPPPPLPTGFGRGVGRVVDKVWMRCGRGVDTVRQGGDH
jgi:hypothetical protein